MSEQRSDDPVMPEDSMHRTLDRALRRAHHPCPSCKGENTIGTRNSEGHWHGRCTACGLKFWGND